MTLTYQQRAQRKYRVLTLTQAAEIRRRFCEEKARVSHLAREYRVSYYVVECIVLGRSYQDAGGPIYVRTGRINPDGERRV